MTQSEERKNPLLYLFSKTWHYSDGNRHNIVKYWVMFVIAETVDLCMPLLWARMIDVVARQGVNHESMRSLIFILSLVLVRTIFVWSLHGPARIIEQINSFKARVNYRRYLTKGVLSLPLEWHVDHHSGDTIDKINKGVNALGDFSEDSFIIIYCFVRFVVSFVMLSVFFPQSVFVVVPLMFVSALITMRFDRKLIPKYRELSRNENHVSESITDAITNISTVIILRVERLVFGAIMHKVEKPFELFKETIRLNEWKWFITSVMCNTMLVLVLALFFLINFGKPAGVLVASLYVLIRYLNEIGDLFFQFCSRYGDIVKRRTRIGNAEELSQDFVEGNFSNHLLPKDWRMLNVSNLSFSYYGDASDQLHLDEVSLSFRRGEKVAFIGKRGSGKTTFLKLMRGLYSPCELELSVDGEKIANGFDGISQAITLVQQDPELFAQTIEKNVTMGAEYERDFVTRFTDMACFTEVVEAFPDKKGVEDKFQYSIKEKGINLSGGQRQCLALSRGLLACAEKDIVLLDEPTSSLDTITSITVYRNILREFNDKTVISTVHQLDLLPNVWI